MSAPTMHPRTRRLSQHVASALTRPLPADVTTQTQLHVLDTLAAMLSGSRLEPGVRARRYIAGSPAGRCLVVGSTQSVSTIDAALVNGMFAHADETDDAHVPTLSHPGCAVLPAALAVAQERRASGRDLLRAVTVGYDVGPRIIRSLGGPYFRESSSGPSTHAVAGVFSATAAAAALCGLTTEQVAHALSFAAQSASGSRSWIRDVNHVEKAFVFGGMPASNGVRAAQMVAAGFDGVIDPFHGEPNYLDGVSGSVDRDHLDHELGQAYCMSETNIKRFAVGSPAQAAIQATLDIVAEHGVDPRDVGRLTITLAEDVRSVVDGRPMPDVNIQYLVTSTLLDGRFSFAAAHDTERMTAPEVTALMGLTRLVGDPAMNGRRCAVIEVQTHDGRVLSRRVDDVRGTAANPMTTDEVVVKAVDLVTGVIGSKATDDLVELCLRLDDLPDLDDLITCLTA